MTEPIICFGQQPSGLLPKRFLWAKITAARALQEEIGGRIVYFFHDSDHDLRETMTVMRDLRTGALERINFRVESKIQKKFTPLSHKRIAPGWQAETARRLPRFMRSDLVEIFTSIRELTVADFCLQMYLRTGLLDGIEVVRSSDPAFRSGCCSVDDLFIDIDHEGEVVRARVGPDGVPRLHQGGERYLELPPCSYGKEQVSASRDSRLVWMQSALHCTHYVTGASETDYLDCSQTPEILFVPRHTIEEPHLAYIP